MAGRGLHCASTSSTGSKLSSNSSSSGGGRSQLPPHPLTTTSIKQIRDLESILQPDPDAHRKEQSWIEVYSLESLKLTLDHIIQHCRSPRQQVLVEFPFSQYLSVLNTTKRSPPVSPSRPQTNVDKKKLEVKKKELKLLIKFYKNRILWLSSDSRLFWGLISGSSVALLVESSQCLEELEGGSVFEQYKTALKLLLDEQLVNKNVVYCIKYGKSFSPQRPQALPFTKFKTECINCCTEWISSLKGDGKVKDSGAEETEAEGTDGEEGGRRGCNLLEAIKVALELPDLDTICILLSTKPNQPLDIISHYLVDKLSGEDAPKLHLVSFNASEDIHTSLSDLAAECCGHFHSYCTTSGPEGEGVDKISCPSMEDSDIQSIREEIVRAERVLGELRNLGHGALGEQLLEILRELSMSIEWEEDDDFPFQAPPTGEHCLVCTTLEWLIENGIEGQRLNLYHCLAPNAYPQLDDHVHITDSTVVSQVYNVMPLIPWKDGSVKYLHVDVHGLERYLSQLHQFIVDRLQRRLSWLQSGSRVPFGVWVEPRVLLVVDSSYTVMGQILKLQQHFRLLLEEQLAYVKEFNLIGCGQECRMWTTGFAEPNRQSLRQAWEWILGISPSGSNNLLSALKLIFESGDILEEDIDGDCACESVGIYLVISSMPDQEKDVLCGYLEQVTAGCDVNVHVIYYNTEPLSDPSLYCGNEGGRCGTDLEVQDYLQELARAGKGRFHHFRVSGSCEGDDISDLMDEIVRATEYLEEGKRILNDYREFCRRNVRTPSELTSADHKHVQAPPIHPRQNASSLARMNACQRQADVEEALSNRSKQIYYLKNQYFYTGRRLDKVRAYKLVMTVSSRKSKPKPPIPQKEEYVSSNEWIAHYGIDALGLQFADLIPPSTCSQKSTSNRLESKPLTYRHISHQGEVAELCVAPKGLKSYGDKLKMALKRYCDRLHWLERDENKYFGVILEPDVMFLLDISSSMSGHLQEMKDGFSIQLNNMSAKTKKFNVVAFSTSVHQWHSDLVPVCKDSVSDALQWLNELKAEGNSYLLQALRESLKSGATGIYLVTDGAADHTHEFLLNQLPSLCDKYGSAWRIHTIGWYCSGKSVGFLKQLAESTGGRFHRYPDISDGDDHTLMTREVTVAQHSLTQTSNFLH